MHVYVCMYYIHLHMHRHSGTKITFQIQIGHPPSKSYYKHISPITISIYTKIINRD